MMYNTIQAQTIFMLAPFVLECLHRHASGELEPGYDGRYSAGPLDIAAALSSPQWRPQVPALMTDCCVPSCMRLRCIDRGAVVSGSMNHLCICASVGYNMQAAQRAFTRACRIHGA